MRDSVLLPIAGMRTWLVEEQGDQFFLRSVYHPETWFAGTPLKAACHAHAEHDFSPVLDCTCGVYIWNGDFLTSHDFPVQRSIDLVNVIYGEAFGWGHIVQHAYGLRCEFAQPSSLVDLGSSVIRTSKGIRERQKVLEKLSSVYGIPVVQPGFKIKEGCECPLCKTESRGYSEFDLSSILPPDESPSRRKIKRRRR